MDEKSKQLQKDQDDAPSTLTSDLKDFKKISIFICIIGDILLCYYIWSLFSDFEHFKTQVGQSLNILKSVNEFKRENLPLNFEKQIHSLLIHSLKIMLAGFLFVHTIIYGFFMFEKSFSLKYVKLMLWPAAISSLLIAFSEMSTFDYTYLFFVQAILYIYVALHLKKVRNNEFGFFW